MQEQSVQIVTRSVTGIERVTNLLGLTCIPRARMLPSIHTPRGS